LIELPAVPEPFNMTSTMTNRAAIVRLLEYWLARAAQDEDFANHVKITDLLRGSAFAGSRSGCVEDRPRLRVIQGGRQPR
jgi:hypothetical protein